MRMGLAGELAQAVRLSMRVMRRAPFWRALGWQLFAQAIVCALCLLPMLLVRPADDPGLSMAIVALVLLVAPPVLARACAPATARAVAAAMPVHLPERAAPGLGSFALWWSGVLLLMVAPLAVWMWIPGPARIVLYLVVALILGGFQARCALCVHASARELRILLASVLGRRTLLWMPLAILPFVGAACVAKTGVFEPRVGLALLCVFDAFWYVALSTLWAALYLPLLARHTGATTPMPQALPAAYATPPRFAVVAVLTLVLAGAGYDSRLFLIHRYLSLTDIAYRAHYLDMGGDAMRESALGKAIHEAACTNNLARLQLLLRAGAAPENGDLHRSLICAVRAGHEEAVTYLVRRSGEPNAAPRAADRSALAPRTALQHAVDSGRAGMVALLLSLGADPSLQFDSAGAPLAPPIQIAAFKRDFKMVAQLIKAGADAHAPYPAPPMFMVVDGAAQTGSPDWASELDKAARAGLSLSARDQHGRTLLHWAAWKGQSHLVAVLLARGMDPLAEDRAGAQPFMHLLAWYGLAAEQEPGREFEQALAALADDVPDLNRRTPQAAMDDAAAPRIWREGWSIAQTAARRPRVRAALGKRIDYSTVGARDWPFRSAAEAEALIADLSDRELLAAASLSAGLRQQGWTELAVLVEQRMASGASGMRRDADARPRARK